MPLAHHFSPFALVLCAAGCSKEAVNPLDCSFADYVDRVSVAATPPAKVDFHADWGAAPGRMLLRLFRSDRTRVHLLGCGRDPEYRQWELQATWSRLQDGAAETTATFFDLARLAAGERLGAGEPNFAGSLLRCQPDPVGCGVVDRAAFAYTYTASVGFTENVTGVATLRGLDFELGHLSADIIAHPGEPREDPASHIEIDINWDAQLLAERSAAEGGAGSE